MKMKGPRQFSRSQHGVRGLLLVAELLTFCRSVQRVTLIVKCLQQFQTIIQSFKYASTIEMVGSITQDRVSAIAGVIGKVPQLAPLTITVLNGKKRHEFYFEMIRHKGMTPILAWISVLLLK